MPFPTTYCPLCNRPKRRTTDLCGRCRQKRVKSRRLVPACRQCGKNIHASSIHASSIDAGRCSTCRSGLSVVSNVQSPPHIQRRIEVYAARVEAGEFLFTGFERDLLEECGVRV